jgi:hypothetical protein
MKTVRQLAAEYLPEGSDGMTALGRYSVIATRTKAGKTPIFRDLAPDVLWATETLIQMIQEARDRVEAQTRDQPVAQSNSVSSDRTAVDTESILVPSTGTF